MFQSYNKKPLKKDKKYSAQHVCEHINKNSSPEAVPLNLNISGTGGKNREVK
jgi:hypothetical protein